MYPDEELNASRQLGRVAGLQAEGPRSRTETERAIDFLAEEIERTHKLVEMLALKLSPVVAPAPESAKGGIPVEGFASPLAANISGKAADIAVANRRLAELHASIQL